MLALDTMLELDAALREIATTEALGVILAGRGPVFSAGHNFGDMLDADAARRPAPVPRLHRHDEHGPAHARRS